MDMEKLTRSVLRHSGMTRSRLIDVCRGGADAGFPGFTYNTDAIRFYNRHETEIYDMLRDTAEQMGSKNVEELISGFVRADMADDPETRKVLLAWFAFEEIARYCHPDY
jgi:hypothetical protein